MEKMIRFDWAIKRLLRNKANFGILEGLLSELLKEDIKIEGLLESESNKQTTVNKMNRVDLLVKISSGELIIIEVQSDYTRDYLTRILFGTSKLMVDNMDQGMKYRQIKKIISVNIVFFDLGHGEDYLYYGRTIFTGMNKGDILELSKQEQMIFDTGLIENVYPRYYIIKVNQFDEVAKNTVDEWINFIKTGEVKENTLARGLKEAQEKMKTLKLSKEDMAAYESDLDAWRDNESLMDTKYVAGEIKGFGKGIEIGKEEGIEIGEANKEQYAEERAKNKAIEMAKKCIQKGIPIPEIADLTGLRENEIRVIAKS